VQPAATAAVFPVEYGPGTRGGATLRMVQPTVSWITVFPGSGMAASSVIPVAAVPKRVALLIETSKAFGRGVLRGISRWQREHEPWRVFADERGFNEPVPADMATAAWDGIITRLQRREMPAAWSRDDLPLVSLRWEEADVPSPGVHSDETAIAQLAADHLLEQGFLQLAFCGVDTRWSRLRERAFADHAEARGVTAAVFDPPQARRTGMRPDDLPAIARWIESLPKPVGIMAAYDVRALEVLDAVRSLGLACPDDVAVIGVDNDEVLCDLAAPALSSVNQNLECIGYEAARLLAARMAGHADAAASLFIPPLGVAVRRSTDVLAVDDPDVRRGLRLIRAKACDGLTPDDVATATDLPRRSLDRQFTKLLGRSIHDEIARTKLQAAKRLLAETDLKLSAVAARCHFAHAAQLCNVFKRTLAETPTEYRRRCRPWA